MDNSGGAQPRSGGYSRKERMERKIAEINSQDQIAVRSNEQHLQHNNIASHDDARYNQTFARADAPVPFHDANESSDHMNRKVGGTRTSSGNASFSSSRGSGSSSQRGVDDGLQGRSSLTSSGGRQQTHTIASLPSISPPERNKDILEGMSLDGKDVDVNQMGPVRSVSQGRTISGAATAAAANNNVIPLVARGRETKQRTVVETDDSGGPTPGAYSVQGRAIGSVPAWVRQFGRNSRRLSNRSRGHSDDQSHIPPELRVSNSAPPELRNEAIDMSVPPELRVSHQSVPPEVRGISDGDQNAREDCDEEGAPILQTAPVEEIPKRGPTKAQKRVIFGILAILLLGGVGAGVGIALTSGGGQASAAASGNTTTATNDPPSPASAVPAPTPSPADCKREFDMLSSVQRNCLCAGTIQGWEGNASTVEQLIVDPSLKSLFARIKWDNISDGSCDANNVAMHWLAEDIDKNNSPQETWGQRFLLASLFLAWTGQEPLLWKVSTNWLSGKTVCDWFGVSCDASGQITSLRLPNNELLSTGGLPKEIFELTSLTSVDLSFNSLEISPIANDIIKLTNLLSLNLRDNTVSGELPFDFFPSSLVELNLQETKMQTSIPTTVTNMVNLEILDLTHSGITGLLPSEIGALTKLTQLSLGENVFIGDIPSEFTMLSLLESFDLSINLSMETTLPTEIGFLTGLVEFNLDGVLGSGSIPSEIGLLANLTQLGLQGQIGLYGGFDTIRKGFLGSIPSEIGMLSKLESLNLGGNNLSGTIPSEIGQLIGLRKCDLGFNLLTGTIPSQIAALANLQSLRLRGIVREVTNGRNEIMGTFPSGLGDLDNLTCFDASGTLLTGSIPESMCFNTVNSTVFVNVRCVGIGSACSCCKCEEVDQCTLSI